MLVDEANDHFDGRSSSAAKKADALFKISLARFASANSARSRRFSASRSTDSAGVALPESLCLRTQTRKVSLLRPSSFATRVIAPFALSGSAWAWMTSSTARALSSSVYFTGKRETPSFNLPASITPGAIQLSAHETITAEQEHWGSIAQLAAEYDTIAQAAQHDRWAALLQASGLTVEQTEDVLASSAYGALSAELRRAEANHHDVERLLSRLVQARGIEDADDIASVLHARLAKASARPAGSGRTRTPPRMIAGLIPYASGTMSPEMREALDQRRRLMEQRAEALVDKAVDEPADWVRSLFPERRDEKTMTGWRRRARVIAAYRDRYQIASRDPLGPMPELTAQKIDYARAQAAVNQLQAPAAQSPQGERYHRSVDRPLYL